MWFTSLWISLVVAQLVDGAPDNSPLVIFGPAGSQITGETTELPIATIDPTTPWREFEYEASDWMEAPLLLPATQITATHLPRLGRGGFGISSFDLRHTLLLGYDEHPPLNITPGGAVHSWSGPSTIDLPARVFDLYVDMQWQPWQSERATLLLGATPGMYGDFERVDSSTFQWSGWLLGSRRIGTDWALLGGVAYLRQLRSNWLPMGGAVWTPSETTRVELLFPRPKLTRLCYAQGAWQTWGFIEGQFGGGAWSVADTAESNVLLGSSDLRLLGGCEAFSTTGYEWRAEVGYVFARELSVNSTPLVNPADAWMAQVTFAF